MANTQQGYYEIDKLQELQDRLEKVNKEVIRLEAAIKYLQENPGAEALVNSL